jgi:hypothetical protein
VRGLYATKDTFVSLAITCSVNPAWLEQQTGVAWATLRKHYGKYMPGRACRRWTRCARLEEWMMCSRRQGAAFARTVANDAQDESEH